MELRHIKTHKCPTCGSQEVTHESLEVHRWGNTPPRISVHSCGERTERREFVCGYVVEWSPNFSREEVLGACYHNKAYRDIMEKVDQLKRERTVLDDRIDQERKRAYTLLKQR